MTLKRPCQGNVDHGSETSLQKKKKFREPRRWLYTRMSVKYSVCWSVMHLLFYAEDTGKFNDSGNFKSV